VTTSWSIPNSPPGGPQASCLWAVLFPADCKLLLPRIYTDSDGSITKENCGVRLPAMVTIDPEHERRRLAEFYADQLDGELEKVAGQAYELTEIAREALKAELSKRGLTPEFVEQRPVILKKEALPKAGDPPPPKIGNEEPRSGGGELELRDMVTIRKFRDLPEALFAKGSLESAGIECALVDDNMVRLDWFISNLLGGVKLMVNSEDAKEADEILNQPIPEQFDAAGSGEYQQPHCPQCQSLDVAFQELNKPVAYVSAFIGVPLPVSRHAWRCHSCHAEWEDAPETDLDALDNEADRH